MTSAVCYPSYSLPSYSYMDRSFSRDSNTASAPLPHIPRRSSSRNVSNSAVATLQSLFIHTSPATFVIQPPTPPASSKVECPAEDQGSSSSSSESYVEILGSKSRRVRTPGQGEQPQRKLPSVCPPEQSTPTPAVFLSKSSVASEGVAWPRRGSPEPELTKDLDATPRFPARLTTAYRDSNHPRASSNNFPPTKSASSSSLSSSTPTNRTVSSTLNGKKQPQPLKSSLKSRRPVVRGDLSVITGPVSSKSEPVTPTSCKSVHFDAKLEHVKLFLAEQKPLAISREGSPTDDTSGTDSDFPTFIYGKGDTDDDRIKKSLSIDVVNLPPVISPNADVALESLVLSEDGCVINGQIRVRNIAFEKWVVVRFTFDNWQTTSEVSTKYLHSLPGGVFDRFEFSIRLHDLLQRIEEKTLFLAVRYTVTGKEIWDNNSGQNYQVRFRCIAEIPSARFGGESSSKIKELKSRLEQVANDTVGGKLASSRRSLSASASPSPSPPATDNFTLKDSTPLSKRYDFSASLKSPPWKSRGFAGEERPRTSTYPNSLPNFPRRSFLQKKSVLNDPQFLTRGSPRIVDDRDHEDDVSGVAQAKFFALPDLEDTPIPLPRRQKARNHQRGYFDLGMGISQGSAVNVRRTPPGTPPQPAASPIMRFNSFPPSGSDVSYRSASVPSSLSPALSRAPSPWEMLTRGGSEESTPSISSNENSESSAGSSPAESPIELPSVLGYDRYEASPVETRDYNVLLDRFCFFTGADSFLDASADHIHRSHSASSVEELLSSPNPSGNFFITSPAATPTRSSSFDDVSTISGSSTPTSHMFGTNSPSPPSVAFVH